MASRRAGLGLVTRDPDPETGFGPALFSLFEWGPGGVGKEIGRALCLGGPETSNLKTREQVMHKVRSEMKDELRDKMERWGVEKPPELMRLLRYVSVSISHSLARLLSLSRSLSLFPLSFPLSPSPFLSRTRTHTHSLSYSLAMQGLSAYALYVGGEERLGFRD